MPSKKSQARNTRTLFNHGPGKGDKSRVTDVAAYRDNFDVIDWGNSARRVLDGLNAHRPGAANNRCAGVDASKPGADQTVVDGFGATGYPGENWLD
jgi:hypothetical protein